MICSSLFLNFSKLDGFELVGFYTNVTADLKPQECFYRQGNRGPRNQVLSLSRRIRCLPGGCWRLTKSLFVNRPPGTSRSARLNII